MYKLGLTVFSFQFEKRKRKKTVQFGKQDSKMEGSEDGNIGLIFGKRKENKCKNHL